MLGVTIGVGQLYAEMAKIAARCFTENTGYDVAIIDDSIFRKKSLRHPAALKMQIFDLFADDKIIYFDADWFCNERLPVSSNNETGILIACHDFIYKDDWPQQYLGYLSDDFQEYENYYSAECNNNVREDYISEILAFSGIHQKPHKWINTGFWIAERANHRDWLNTSFDYYNNVIGHHSKYYEQPAMNLALQHMNIQVDFLPRAFNTLVASKRKWPSRIKGFHVKVKHHPRFINAVLDGKITCSEEVINYFF